MESLEELKVKINAILTHKGYYLTKDNNTYLEYKSDGKNALKHVIKGFNQVLYKDQRIINMSLENDYIDIGIKCDGGTRTIFNGVATNPKNILKIIELID